VAEAAQLAAGESALQRLGRHLRRRQGGAAAGELSGAVGERTDGARRHTGLRQHAVLQDVAQVERLHVEAGEVEVEGQARDRPVAPQGDAHQVGARVGVGDREHRGEAVRGAEIDAKPGDQQRRRRPHRHAAVAAVRTDRAFRHVFAGVAEAVAVRVELGRVGPEGTVVAGVAEAVEVDVGLVGVDRRRAVVAEVAAFADVAAAGRDRIHRREAAAGGRSAAAGRRGSAAARRGRLAAAGRGRRRGRRSQGRQVEGLEAAVGVADRGRQTDAVLAVGESRGGRGRIVEDEGPAGVADTGVRGLDDQRRVAERGREEQRSVRGQDAQHQRLDPQPVLRPALGLVGVEDEQHLVGGRVAHLGELAGEGLRGPLLLVAARDPRRAAGRAGTEDVDAAVPRDAARFQVVLLDGEQRLHVAEAAALMLHGAGVAEPRAARGNRDDQRCEGEDCE
jgi:hypothetical protein